MEKNVEIKLSLVICISLFLHLILFIGIVSPDFNLFMQSRALREKLFGGRDIIVNINQDDRRTVTPKTLLSDRDSHAKGHITEEKGDHWLNNFRDFVSRRGWQNPGRGMSRSGSAEKEKLVLSDNSEVVVTIMRYYLGLPSTLGDEGEFDFTRIPDRNTFSRKNAIYYTNDGRFSFNTLKFKPFKYFRDMKDRIASHWFPPPMANVALWGYAPGRTRIIAIPSQIVKIYFIMNRNGDVLDIRVFESLGNRPLDDSCVKSIQDSKSFGTVPPEIPGDTIVIPFMFGYFVY